MSFAVDLYMVRVSDPKIQNQPPVLYVLLRKLFSRSSYFFLLEKLFWRKFSAFRFCSCFMYGSCIGQKSEDPEDLRRPSSTKSSAVFWFDCVYVRDVPEDPEDFYKLYVVQMEKREEPSGSSVRS